mgnify:FL=1
MIVEHLNNILSKDFNNNILNELSNIQGWRISPDEFVKTQGDLEDGASDSGMLLTSFDKELGFPFTQELESQYSFLNVSANHIFQSVLQNSKYIFHNVELERYLWNYYNRSSDGVDHTDSEDNNKFSVTYYLHDSDGGTLIDDIIYKSISNDAVIFKSNTPHRGIGPKKSKKRFLLNIVFRAEGYKEK